MWRGTRSSWAIAASGVLAVLALPAAAAAVKKPGTTPKVKTRTSTSTAAGNGAIVSTTALCPAKHRAVGGGFEETAPTIGAQGIVYESVKSGQSGWRVSSQILDQMAPIDSVTLTVYVYCRKPSVKRAKTHGGATTPKTKTSSSTAATPAANQTGPTAQAICSKGRRAMAGGFATTPPIVGASARPIVLDSLRSGSSSWQTLVLSGATHAGSVTSHAYCAKKVKAPSTHVAVGPSTVDPFGVSAATADCPPKKNPVHGGFRQTGATPNTFILIFESRAVGNSWRVSGSHLGPTASSVESSAYCA
jgi:hypothetical protein